MESTVSTKVSIEEFLSNPDIHYYDFHELHNGEIVEVTPPSAEHVRLQIHLQSVLQNLLQDAYIVVREFYFVLSTEGRRADVAAVEANRWRGWEKGVFTGSPEIVIEILSPSNRAADLTHLRRVCLDEGAEQFWVVDPFEQMVEIYRRDGSWKEYSYKHEVAINLNLGSGKREYALQVRNAFE